VWRLPAVLAARSIIARFGFATVRRRRRGEMRPVARCPNDHSIVILIDEHKPVTAAAVATATDDLIDPSESTARDSRRIDQVLGLILAVP